MLPAEAHTLLRMKRSNEYVTLLHTPVSLWQENPTPSTHRQAEDEAAKEHSQLLCHEVEHLQIR